MNEYTINRTMKYTLKSIFLLMIIGNLAFINGCSNNREWSGECRSKEYSWNSYNKEVIGFKSDFPQSELPEHNNVLLFDEGNGPLFQYYDATFCRIPEETEYPFRALLINKLPPPSKGGIWRSKDGLKWELLPDQHKLDVPFEANKPTYDPFKERYLGYLRLWDPPVKPVSSWRKVILSESITTKRGIDWTEKELVLAADENDGPTTDIYNMQVTAYAGIYVGFPEMFHRRGFKQELQGTLYNELAFSQDGRNWQRISQGQAFLPIGSPGNWDHGMVRIMSNPVIINNELYFYFQGIRGLHIHPQKPGWGQRACGLATLRLDGFCSLDAGPEGGTLLTVPFWPEGKHLYINADAREGEIRVEVLQEYSAPGNKETGLFSLENCIPFSGDALAHRVEWKHGENFMDDFPDGWNVDLQYIDEGKTRNFSKRAIELKIGWIGNS